jgi:hypothetical protein
MEKAGRNDPCPCGSGKKFKKCCEALSSGKAPISKITNATVISGSNKMSSLFSRQVVPVTIPAQEKPSV